MDAEATSGSFLIALSNPTFKFNRLEPICEIHKPHKAGPSFELDAGTSR